MQKIQVSVFPLSRMHFFHANKGHWLNESTSNLELQSNLAAADPRSTCSWADSAKDSPEMIEWVLAWMLGRTGAWINEWLSARRAMATAMAIKWVAAVENCKLENWTLKTENWWRVPGCAGSWFLATADGLLDACGSRQRRHRHRAWCRVTAFVA